MLDSEGRGIEEYFSNKMAIFNSRDKYFGRFSEGIVQGCERAIAADWKIRSRNTAEMSEIFRNVAITIEIGFHH